MSDVALLAAGRPVAATFRSRLSRRADEPSGLSAALRDKRQRRVICCECRICLGAVAQLRRIRPSAGHRSASRVVWRAGGQAVVMACTLRSD
jgi:hypothetical protein